MNFGFIGECWLVTLVTVGALVFAGWWIYSLRKEIRSNKKE